ncbi:hypothetical protein FUAX_09000 [Fulvitalea axinellae]|uniref:Uncharacterized protein n=1 Tax=Fulvitalea axinellae TaxID=1182444 RepID=A0AAU9CXV2_9BACT|nr:hypothetical protein FUAX_09000 [Fulvitalea axinellae]
MKKILRTFKWALVSFLFFSCDACQDPDPNPKPEPGDEKKIVITTIATPTDQTLRSIHFLDENIGYAAGGDEDIVSDSTRGVILKTVDGGETWAKVFERKYRINDKDDRGVELKGGGFEMTSVFAKSANEVFATSFLGRIHTSKDGGETWSMQYSVEGDDVVNFYGRYNVLEDITFFDDNFGVVVGKRGNYLGLDPDTGFSAFTMDGGDVWIDILDGDPAEWRRASTNTINQQEVAMRNNPLTSAKRYGEKMLFLTGGLTNKGTLTTCDEYTIESQTNKWEVMTPKQDQSNAPKFVDSAIDGDFIVVVGNNGLRSPTTEKGAMFSSTTGKDWQPVPYGGDNKLTAVDVKGQTMVIVGINKGSNTEGPEFVSLSFDRGATWTRIEHDHNTADWKDVYMLSEKKMFMVGAEGLIMKLEVKE